MDNRTNKENLKDGIIEVICGICCITVLPAGFIWAVLTFCC